MAKDEIIELDDNEVLKKAKEQVMASQKAVKIEQEEQQQ